MLLFDRIYQYLSLVRFSHTLFALPFAFISALAAKREIPPGYLLGWILFCMVTARTSAMAFNRIADRRYDGLNPRTKNRELPSGKVSLGEAVALWLLASILFVFGARQINGLAFALSIPALIIICSYSYWKRFSDFSHFILGLSLGIAPVGAWIAVTGAFNLPPLILAAGVLFWVAGFDIIYALMDEEFDRRVGLHSLVVRLGKSSALKLAFVVHGLSIVLVFYFGWLVNMGWIYYSGILGYAALILYEHHLVSPEDITRVNQAFFTVNGIISIGLLLFSLTDILLLS